MIKTLTRNLSVLGLALAACMPAMAGVINFSLVNPPQLAAPNTILSFSATVSAPLANSAPVFLNADSNTIDFPLTLDDSGFTNFPRSLAPGGSFTGVVFTVSVPPDVTSFNSYNGYFEIDGGGDGGAVGFLDSVNFQIEAVPATTVPEPGNLVLPLLGLAGMAVLRGKRRTEQRG